MLIMLNRYSFEDTLKSKEDLLKLIFKTLEPVLITLFTLSNRIIVAFQNLNTLVIPIKNSRIQNAFHNTCS